MKTTLDIDEVLLARAEARAMQEGKTLSRLVEEGLRLRLSRHALRYQPALAIHGGRGGLVRGVDPLSNRAMFETAREDT